jgi:HAD superfamily hydrolase (TIGR01509 family)
MFLDKTMSRFSAVVFDMDGVLLDSEPLHHGVLNDLLARDRLVLERPEYERFIGWTSEAMFEALIAQHGLAESVAEYSARYADLVLRVLQEPLDPAPGVVALVQRLRELNMGLAVASSSQRSWIEVTLQSLGLAEAFDTLVSADDVEHGKPDPAIYLLAAERLGVAPDRCVAIEDSPSGVRSARDAGMFVVGVRPPYTARLHLDGAERIVDSLAELDLSGEVFS